MKGNLYSTASALQLRIQISWWRTSEYQRKKAAEQRHDVQAAPTCDTLGPPSASGHTSSPHRLTKDKRLNLISPVFSLLQSLDLKFSSWGKRTPIPINSLSSPCRSLVMPVATCWLCLRAYTCIRQGWCGWGTGAGHGLIVVEVHVGSRLEGVLLQQVQQFLG